MRPSNLTVILFIAHLFLMCDRKTNSESSKVEITEVSITEEEVDDVPPPPPEFTSNFKNVQEWLSKLCNTEKPEKPIATYSFGLFEASGDYTLFVVGLNKYEKDNYFSTRIEFEPSNMYFRLPKSEYQNLDRAQLLAKLTSELKNFTETQEFKTSFLAKARSITTEFSGEIWPK